MSRFYARNTFLIPAVLAAALFFAIASPMQAKPPQESEPSGTRAYWECLGQCLDILAQSGEAAKRMKDPKQSMLIRVVDAQGKPIAGACVQSYTIRHVDHGWTVDTSNSWFGESFSLATTKTDGTARVVRPTSKDEGVWVSVQAGGYVWSASQWNESEDLIEAIPSEFTFKLERSRPIGGVVRDASGKPVVGATVSLRFTDREWKDRVKPDVERQNAITDEQGRWQCHHTPPQLKGIRICVEREDLPPMDLNPAACMAQSNRLQTQNAVFVMDKAYVIRGTITNLQGKPIPSVQVSIRQFGDSMIRIYPAITDKDGRYSFSPARPGACEITVVGRQMVSQHRTIKVTPDLASVDFRLKPGRTIKIRVVDPAGRPVAGANVEDEHSPGGTSEKVIVDSSTTDSNGRWATGGEPEGKLAFCVHKEGSMRVYRELAASDKEYVITLGPPIRVTGRIINAATREPIRHAVASPLSTPLGKQPDICFDPRVTIDDDGSYAMSFEDDRGIDALAWRIRVMSPGYVTTTSRRYETREGSQKIDIEMLPGPSVSGVVRRPDGTPATGATVFLSTAADSVSIENGRFSPIAGLPLLTVETAADGRFELPMPLAPYLVGVIHESGGAEIAAPDLESRGEIIVQPWARVVGYVQRSTSTNPKSQESVNLHVNRGEGISTPSGRDRDRIVEEVVALLERGNIDNDRPRIDWSYSCEIGSSRRFVFDRVLPGRAEIEPSSTETCEGGGTLCWMCYSAAGELASPWRTQNFTTQPGRTSHVEFVRKGRPVTGRIRMPSDSPRKIATTGGCGVLVFQRPIVPVPAEIAKQSVEVRKQWEKRWLESEAGQAADRAAQDHSFSVAADGAFKTEGVAPGVYKLAVEFFRVSEKPLEIDHDIAWFVQEVTIPAGAKDKPLDLGKHTAIATNLLRGDVAPDFEFQTADGRTHRLSEYRGKKVIVNFTEKWDAMERFGGTPEMNLRHIVSEKAGPTVWINVSSDSGPRPAVKFAQDAKFQYIQAFVPPKADVWNAYDVNRPRSWVETHIAQDGKVIRK